MALAPVQFRFSALQDLGNRVIASIANSSTRTMYGKALQDFFGWWSDGRGGSPLSKELIQDHVATLSDQGYSASTINQRLSAIRRLALRAVDGGLLAAEHGVAILRLRGARSEPATIGRRLTDREAESLINSPDSDSAKGRRDRAILALLVGCGLRRGEIVRLCVDDLQRQEGRWVLLNVKGAHGRVRTVPLPPWAKAAVDHWLQSAGILTGSVFRALDRDGRGSGRNLSAAMVQTIVAGYGKEAGIDINPRDLRRTCANLCRDHGADLEQIQMLLGHTSIQITERYLGARQNNSNAPNDRLGLKWRKPRRLAS